MLAFMVLSWIPNTLTVFRCGLAALCAMAILLGARADGVFRDAFLRGHANLGGEPLPTFISRTAQESGLFLWPLLALSAFLLAAISDYADGALARKLNAQSAFGAWLDPVADKLLVGLALVALSIAAGSLWLMLPTAIIVLRDIYITWLRGRLGGGLALPVMAAAKWKTATEMLAIACLLLAQTVSAAGLYETGGNTPLAGAFAVAGGLPLWSLGLILIWVSALLSMITGASYRKAALQAFETERARVFD